MSRNGILEEFSGHRAKQLVGEIIPHHSSDLWKIAQRVQWSIGRDFDLTLFQKFVNELQTAGGVEFKNQ